MMKFASHWKTPSRQASPFFIAPIQTVIEAERFLAISLFELPENLAGLEWV